MKATKIRPVNADDWCPTTIKSGRYFNETTLTGFMQSDGMGGNVLHPASENDDLEAKLLKAHTTLESTYPGVRVLRRCVKMPYWRGQKLPTSRDYTFVNAPERLTTTSISIILVPQNQIKNASMGFYFRGKTLPSLRERLKGSRFHGVVGNLGYYMTKGLINEKHIWSHNARYPAFPLPDIPSYIGFHLFKDNATGQSKGAFQGAHPGAVGIRKNGGIDILPGLKIQSYTVTLGTQNIVVRSIDNPGATNEDVMLFTPALKTTEIEEYITACEISAGSDDSWKTYTPFVPVADIDNRVNVFITNEGNGKNPVEKVMAVWEGKAPLPSFGAILSFRREYFSSLFETVETFKHTCLNRQVRIIPDGGISFDDYAQMMGGFVPAVVNGKHLYCAETTAEVMRNLSHYGNATSPITLAGKETKNFDPYIREPAGVLVQTESSIGWILFDGRHELSIGANVVDVAILLKKLESEGVLGTIQQAIFIDGGSAMKAYAACSDETAVSLDLLNRVAAGSRNSAGADPDGLNLYSVLALGLR